MKVTAALPLMTACALIVGSPDARAQTQVDIVNPLPVPVRTTVPAAPHQRSVNSNVWTNAGSGTTSFINFSGLWGIPAGRVFVVEHVSLRVRVNPGERISVSVTCQGTPAGLSAHRLVLTSQGTFDGFEHLAGTTPLRCYTNNSLLVNIIRNSQKPLTLVANTEFSVSGFLADVP
jgi:hypothetical protein